MDHAALPPSFGKEVGQGFQESQAFVGRNEADSPEPTFLEVPQEGGPAFAVLSASLADAEHLAVSLLADADGHENGDVPDLSAPALFQPDTVEKDVRSGMSGIRVFFMATT